MFKGSWWKNRNSKRFGRAQAQPQAQQGAGGRESLIRGLPPVATEGHPIIPSYPTCFGAGGGWVILSLPIGPGVGTSGQFGQDRRIPCGWQALVFPPAWERIISDQLVLKVLRQGYFLQFVKSLPLARILVQTLLPMLQFSWEDLWEEV